MDIVMPWGVFGARRRYDHRPRPRRSASGFTLIELMIVIMILGVLAVIGMANFQSMRQKAKYASCISNQRHIHEAAILYSMDNNVGTVTINVTVLWGANLITQEGGECDSSSIVDFDDYNIDYINGEFTNVVCSIKGAEHLYTP